MITELLGKGAAAAIPARELIDVLNIDKRTFYSIVEKERREGSAICASKSPPVGYYLAATKTEAWNYTRMVDATAHEMRRTTRLIRKAAAELPEV